MSSPKLESLQPHCPYEANIHAQLKAASRALIATGRPEDVPQMMRRAYAGMTLKVMRTVIADYVVVDPPLPEFTSPGRVEEGY